MGGYAPYVWSAFGFAILVLLGLLVQSFWTARRRDAELARLRELARPAERGSSARRPRLTPKPETGRPEHQA